MRPSSPAGSAPLAVKITRAATDHPAKALVIRRAPSVMYVPSFGTTTPRSVERPRRFVTDRVQSEWRLPLHLGSTHVPRRGTADTAAMIRVPIHIAGGGGRCQAHLAA